MKQVAVVGATGAVGAEIVRLLEERNFPLSKLVCIASPKSVGKEVLFRGEKRPIQLLSKESLQGVDLAFFAAGSAISKEWIPKIGCLCIDSSSALRMKSDVPLVIPEINRDAIRGHRVVASPNCTATILLMPLAPLHRLFKAKRVIVSSYQAASGGGVALLNHLREETQAYLEAREHPPLFPFPYAFNVYLHNSKLLSNGYVEEEMKMAEETRKILGDESIRLSATCVRVPVLRAHSVSANVEFERPFSLDEVYKAIRSMPGLQIFEERETNRFPTPADASGKNEVLCGRFRLDQSQPNTLEFWSVGDQLLKGAALNAVQIGEAILQDLSLTSGQKK
jgi:aspartate-semialdehyde dehydrogenase